MKITEKIRGIILIILLISVKASGLGETGAQFLKMGVGAKACALGEAFAGVADDPTAIYWNPAGLAQLDRIQILGMQNFWLLDMSYQYVAGAVPLPLGFGSLGGAVTYSSSGKIPKYENFQKTGDYTAYDAAGTVAYANKFSGFHFGAGLKFIYQKIENENAIGCAGDLGLLYAIGPFSTGVSVQNIGPGIKFIDKADPMPMNVKAGLAVKFGPALLAVDANKPIDNNFRLSLGGEFTIMKLLALRAGYNTANGISAGIGLIYQMISIDYAFTPYKEIDASHRISLNLALGTPHKTKEDESSHIKTKVRITASWTGIFNSPFGQVIGKAKQGETYILQVKQGDWYKILLPDGKTGWILAATAEIK